MASFVDGLREAWNTTGFVRDGASSASHVASLLSVLQFPEQVRWRGRFLWYHSCRPYGREDSARGCWGLPPLCPPPLCNGACGCAPPPATKQVSTATQTSVVQHMESVLPHMDAVDAAAVRDALSVLGACTAQLSVARAAMLRCSVSALRHPSRQAACVCVCVGGGVLGVEGGGGRGHLSMTEP